jgi:hypothetical protein
MFGLAKDHRPKPKVSDQPLTEEEVAVYRAVLKYYVHQSGGGLNVSNTTRPSTLPSGCSDSAREIGIEVANPSSSVAVVHKLSPSVLVGTRSVLVNPKKQKARIRTNDPQNVITRDLKGDQAATDQEVHESVDQAFATGLFSLSEIIFDKSRQHAIVSYNFVCGRTCGHGDTLILEKADEGWKVGNPCGGWIS